MKPIFIISGEKGSGKTSFLVNIIALLQKKSFAVGGFVALHEIESDRYLIKNIKTNEKSLLMQRIATSDQRPNHFKFFSAGVEMGINSINEILNTPIDIAIVDEIGGYELRGELWSSSFTQLVESPIPLLFTVKDRLVDKVMTKWRIEPSLIFTPADLSDYNEALERIMKFF